MKNYLILYRDITDDSKSHLVFRQECCGKNTAEVRSIWNRVYPEREIVGMKVVKMAT